MDNPGNNIDKGGGFAPSDVSYNNDSGSSEGNDAAAAGNKPRSPIDKLTKEELLTKCKNLIAIAQKAKHAKDETLADLKKCQDNASKELEAMMEMVNNHTEEKVALITKTESLQRQLNLTSSELETLQSSQAQLLQSRQEAQDKVEAYEAKIHRIKERFEKHMFAEREKQEKLMETQQELLGKVENLEAQTSQVEVLKIKCKKLVDQNAKLEELSKQAKAAIAEKKANDIILQETKNQKKELEEKANKLLKDVKEFQAKNAQLETAMRGYELEIGELQLKLTALTETQEAKVEEREEGESQKLVLEMKSKIEDYEKKHFDLESLVTQLREKSETTDITEEITESVIYTPCSHETLLAEVEELRSRAAELETTVETNKQLSSKIENLRTDCQSKEEVVSELQIMVDKQEEEKNNLDQLFFDANEKCSLLESELQTLKKQLHGKVEYLSAYSEKKTSFETEIETLKNDLKFQVERNAELQDTNLESTNDFRNYQTSIHTLNSEIEILKSKLEENERLSEKSVSQTDHLQKTIQDLNSQLENSKQKIELLSNAAEFEVKQSSVKDNRLRDLEEKLNEATLQISEKSKLVGKLEASNEFLENRVQELQLEIDGHIQEIKIVKDKINNSLRLSGDKFPGFKVVLGSVPDTHAEGNAVDEGVLGSELDAMLLGLEEYVQSSKKTLADFSAENEKINAELNSVNDEKVSLQKQLGELDERFKESVAALNKELEVVQQSCDNIDCERSSLLEKEAVAAELSKQKDQLEKECSELKECVAETSRENDRLNSWISELQEVEKQLRVELEVKEKDLEDLIDQVHEAKVLNDSLVLKDIFLSGLSDTLHKERASFSEKLENEQRVQADLKCRIETLVEEAAKDQEMVQKYQVKIQYLEQGDNEKMKNLDDVNRELRNECEKWTRENEEFKLVNSNLKEQFSGKVSDCDDLASKISDLEKQLCELKSNEADNAIITVEQQSKFDELREKLKETVETYECKISTAIKNAETVQEELVPIKEENDRYSTQVVELQEELLKATSECKGLEEKTIWLERTKTETEVKLTQVLQEKYECANELSKIREEVLARTAEATKLKDENEKLVSEARQSGMEDDMQVAELKKEKDELRLKLEALERVLQKTQDSLDLTVKENAAMNSDVKQVRENCDKLIKEKELLGSDLEDVTKARDALDTERDSFSKQLGSLNKEMDGAFDELSALTGERDTLKGELHQITSDLQETKSVLEQIQKAREELIITSESCLKELTSKSEECQQLQAELGEIANKCRGLEVEAAQLREAREKAVQLEEQLKTCAERAETAEIAVRASDEQREELDAQYRAATARCQELLQELNEVTGVLRERGERISRLEATLKDRNGDVDHLTGDLKTATGKVAKLEQEKQAYESQLVSVQLQLSGEQSQAAAATEANRREKELQEKIVELVQALEVVKKEKEFLQVNGVCADDKAIGGGGGDKTTGGGSSGDKMAAAVAFDGPAGDALSTSTMSKAEDVHRLKDLEDTFEERYMKLKSVAIKLKKKLAEQTIQLNATEELKNKLLAEKEQLGPVKNASKNIQILQAEVDRLQDSVESGAKSVKESDAQLAAAAAQLAEARDKLAVQTEELSMLQATVKSLEEATAHQKNKESDLQARIIVLQQEASGHEEQDNKQRSLLALELQDSERTIAELRCQLAEHEAAAARSEKQADALRLRVAAMDTQLEHLTAQRAADDTTSQHLRKSVEELRSQLTETEKEAVTLRAVKQQQGAEIEALRQEVENQKVTVTEVSQAKSVTEEQSRRTAAMINKKVAVLEERLDSVTTELQQTTDELQYIKKEFDGYKARAQSVLKQQQLLQQKDAGVDVGELQQRLQLSETQLQTLQHSNRHLQSELSALQSEHKFVQSEKERLCKQQKLDSTKTSEQLASLRAERDKLEEKLQRATADSQAVIAKMAAEGEAMAAGYEGQLKNRAATHEREVCDLQCQLDAVSRKLHDSGPPPTISGGGGVEGGGGGGKHHRRMDSADELRGVDVTSMIREAGEGSEWVEPEQSHHKHIAGHGSRLPSMADPSGDPYQPPPLHQLLLSGTGSADDSVSVSGSAAEQATSGSFLHSQLTALQAKVEAYELRVQQVSALLHESEGENSKLSQLTDALKEEIRRGSRNTDREKHLENLEYLKNVVLQFLTLEEAGTDGRERLLPVLTTLLQLAPLEVKKVEALVKGGRDSSSANQGWGSYLHMWSGR